MKTVPGPGATGRTARWPWRRSRHSNPSGNCVELARLPTGESAVRDSRQPDGPILVYPGGALTAFLVATRSGRFDRPPRQPCRR
jgi:hypothetical protein